MLETYRECLRDVFDLPALVDLLTQGAQPRGPRRTPWTSQTSSPFAASLLFGYVANYLYDGDAPLAERRAQALSVDQAQLRELLGEGELRDAARRRRRSPRSSASCSSCPSSYHARSADARARPAAAPRRPVAPTRSTRAASPASPAAARRRRWWRPARALPVRIAGEPRLIAVEDAARYRDGLGAPLPPGLPASLLEPAPDALGDLRAPLRAHARPVHRRRGGRALRPRRRRWSRRRCSGSRETGRVVEGEFRPGGHGREWCDADVLRVAAPALAGGAAQGGRAGRAARARPLPGRLARADPRRAPGSTRCSTRSSSCRARRWSASVLEREVLPARVAGYTPALLDTLVVGRRGDLGRRRAARRTRRPHRALPHRPRCALLRAAGGERRPARPRGAHRRLAAQAAARRSSAPLHEAAGGGFPQETVDALWSLVWKGLVTNDTLHPLRAYRRRPGALAARRRAPHRFRSRRLVPPSAEGRWSARGDAGRAATPTAWAAALTPAAAVAPRRRRRARSPRSSRCPAASAPSIRCCAGSRTPGACAAATSSPASAARSSPSPAPSICCAPSAIRRRRRRAVTLAATDPANPVRRAGRLAGVGRRAALQASRVAGARVVLVDGHAAAWIARGDRQVLVARARRRTRIAAARGRALARELRAARARRQPASGAAGSIAELNGEPATASPLAPLFRRGGLRRDERRPAAARARAGASARAATGAT